MKKIIYPEKKDWMEILRRPALNTDTLRNTVKEVLDKVKTEGDKAVREYEERFDKVKLDSLGVTETEIAEAEKEVPIELKAAIMLAQKNIHTFHSSQRFEGKKVQTVPGVTCWQKAVAIEKVGLYIPGGTAPLFSTVLMLATPALSFLGSSGNSSRDSTPKQRKNSGVVPYTSGLPGSSSLPFSSTSLFWQSVDMTPEQSTPLTCSTKALVTG